MSTFKVGIEEIATIENHPDADRLEVASLKGMTFQFVVPKGKHRPGDHVVYFPLDAILPSKLVEVLGLTGKLGGVNFNIICTARRRGFISQGIVEFPEVLAKAGLMPSTSWQVGDDVTEVLGVRKHVMVPVEIPGAVLHDLPAVLSEYDIEAADRYGVVAERLMDQLVVIAEKLEGSNYGVHSDDADGFDILKRNNRVVEIPGMSVAVWKLARKGGFMERLAQLRGQFPGESLTITGELLGPGCEEGNHYQLRAPTVRFFDIRHTGRFIDAETKYDLMKRVGFEAVPLIAYGVTLREWLNGRSIREASHGQSLLNPDVIREGIVITPMKEMSDPRIGRLVLKQRDPIYCAKYGR